MIVYLIGLRESFAGHAGRPGLVGGSRPKKENLVNELAQKKGVITVDNGSQHADVLKNYKGTYTVKVYGDTPKYNPNSQEGYEQARKVAMGEKTEHSTPEEALNHVYSQFGWGEEPSTNEKKEETVGSRLREKTVVSPTMSKNGEVQTGYITNPSSIEDVATFMKKVSSDQANMMGYEKGYKTASGLADDTVIVLYHPGTGGLIIGSAYALSEEQSQSDMTPHHTLAKKFLTGGDNTKIVGAAETNKFLDSCIHAYLEMKDPSLANVGVETDLWASTGLSRDEDRYEDYVYKMASKLQRIGFKGTVEYGNKKVSINESKSRRRSSFVFVLGESYC